MAQEVASLQSAIYAILTAPDVDLNTISAKRVRKQLVVQEPSLSEEWIRENKDALDVIIANVFTEVQPAFLGTPEDANGHGGQYEAGPSDASSRRKRKKGGGPSDGAVDGDGAGEERGTSVTKKSKKTKGGVEMTDEEYAKQLSSELNGRPRSSRFAATKVNGSRRGRGGRGKGITSRKDVVDSDGEEDDDGGGAAMGKKRKRRSEGGARGGFSKEYVLSEPLAAVIDVKTLSRPQVVKRLWEYIKGNNLQNPQNKREILCDGPLRAVFGQDKIDMFKMNKVLGDHLHQNDE